MITQCLWSSIHTSFLTRSDHWNFIYGRLKTSLKHLVKKFNQINPCNIWLRFWISLFWLVGMIYLLQMQMHLLMNVDVHAMLSGGCITTLNLFIRPRSTINKRNYSYNIKVINSIILLWFFWQLNKTVSPIDFSHCQIRRKM